MKEKREKTQGCKSNCDKGGSKEDEIRQKMKKRPREWKQGNGEKEGTKKERNGRKERGERRRDEENRHNE